MKLLTLYLIRLHLKETYTIGNLYCVGNDFTGKTSRLIENQFLCNSLEDKFRGNNLKNKKVYGETCIPEGNYQIQLTYSNHFKKTLPKILNVPFFDDILIHSGNLPIHTKGCVLPGMNRVVGQVLDSKIYEDIIVNKIKQYDISNIIVRCA